MEQVKVNKDLPSNNKLKAAVEGVYYGDIADKISKNMKYALGGVAVGAFIGVVAASLLGKNRLLFGLTGAVLAGTVGYISSTKK